MAEKLNSFLLKALPLPKRIELALLLLLPARLRSSVEEVKQRGDTLVVRVGSSEAAQEISMFLTPEKVAQLRAAAGVKKLRRVVVQ